MTRERITGWYNDSVNDCQTVQRPLPPMETYSEQRGSLKVEARTRDGGWEIRVLEEDTPVGLPRVLYGDFFPTMTKSEAYARVTMVFMKLGEMQRVHDAT